jgi:uncharacterized membrane protein
MAAKILLVSFYLLFPVLVIWLGDNYSFIRKIGSIVICYIVGLFVGNIGILPPNLEGMHDILTSVTVPLAIPLLLFSEDIRKWIKLARQTFISLLLGVLSVTIMVVVGYFIFRTHIPECWKVSGMLIGVYTGGTPNLAAIATMLDVNDETYILTNTADLIVGAFVLLFLLTFAQRFFLLFMRPFKSEEGIDAQNHNAEMVDEFESYEGIFTKPVFMRLLRGFGLTVLIFAIGGGASMLVSKNNQTVVAILIITTLGLVASTFPAINRIKKTFQLGMYFILVFSLVVASTADLSKMFNSNNSEFLISIFMYILIAVPGALILHGIISWMFKIDVDNFLITTVALSMSPPFVPVVAAALKNKNIVISGLIIGIIGYAIGNYLGVIVAYTMKYFG